MGKKRTAVLGSPEEQEIKTKKAAKLEQKKLRQGKTAKAPGLSGGQRVVDTTSESLAEYEEIQKRTTISPQPTTDIRRSQGPTQPTTARKARPRSKAYATAKKLINPELTYSLTDGLGLLRKTSLTSFDPSVELHLVLKTKPKTDVKVSLPHSFGKSRRVEVVTDKVLERIVAGKFDFDLLVASPADMPKLVKYAKILGPKGLMPNPKTGTVSDKPEETAKKLASDTAVMLKLDKAAPVIHTVVGKLSFKDKDLEANISAVLAAAAATGLKKAVLKSTMSPAIKLQI